MTTEQKLERIEKLVKELDLMEVTKKEFYSEVEEQRLVDIKDEMWELYCFANDVVVTMKM
jgi:hypothetical protein